VSEGGVANHDTPVKYMIAITTINNSDEATYDSVEEAKEKAQSELRKRLHGSSYQYTARILQLVETLQAKNEVKIESV